MLFVRLLNQLYYQLQDHHSLYTPHITYIGIVAYRNSEVEVEKCLWILGDEEIMDLYKIGIEWMDRF